MDLATYLQTSGEKKADLARSLNVSAPLLYQWVEGIRPVAVQHCAAIEIHTKGAVTRQELRPDDWQLIWPELVSIVASKLKRRRTDTAASPPPKKAGHKRTPAR